MTQSPRLRFAVLLLPALLLGCRKEGGAPRQDASPPPPQRIVVLTPSVEETIFALGLGSRVVGVGDYCRFPPEARSLPQLGGLFNPNLERIVSLRPDLAVLIPSERDLGEKLGRVGIASLIVKNESLTDIEQSFREIARRCGVPAEGERLAAQWKQDLAPQPLSWKPKVMISVGRPAGRLVDVLSAGPGTFYNELLARMGAVNAFGDALGHYPQVSLEEVVARAPDVILELRSDPLPPDVSKGLIDDWNQLPQVPAVRNRRVLVLTGDHVVTPGPRLPQLYRELRAALEGDGASAAAAEKRPHPRPLSLPPPQPPGEGRPARQARATGR